MMMVMMMMRRRRRRRKQQVSEAARQVPLYIRCAGPTPITH
jgi:hypothetical protein